jgi:hypothetical protein
VAIRYLDSQRCVLSSKKGQILNQKLHQKSQIMKDRYRGLVMALTKSFGLGVEHIKINVQDLFFYFITSSLIILCYI